MVILIDNYDSFTYNLLHYIEELGSHVEVYRNDDLSADEVISKKPNSIVISPGPCDPDKAGISLQLVKLAAERSIPLLGVCLGHQSIAQAFGGKVIKGDVPVHGKTSQIFHQQEGVFADIKSPFTATRYHSLIVERKSLPDCFKVTAEVEDGTIMGLEHKKYPLHGVQFHPESIASEHGHKILENFLKLA
jgi:anthranilate synthase component 2